MKSAETGKNIKKAASILKTEGIVAIPTETVYGLAANIFSKKAVNKIYKIKNRPKSNPLIVHVESIDKAKELVKSFPVTATLLAENFWPGPLTLILPKNNNVGPWITAGENTVAIRIPKHSLTLKLLKQTGFPLAAPSANPFKYISPVTAAQVKKMLGDKIEYILDGGKCKKGIESTIVEVKGDKVNLLRSGAITAEQIEKVLGYSLTNTGKKTRSHPGMFKKHYSPHTPLLVTTDVMKSYFENKGKKVAVISFQRKYPLPRNIIQIILNKQGIMEKAAANLYDSLHRLDSGQYDLIIAEKAPELGIGKAINERLKKASA